MIPQRHELQNILAEMEDSINVYMVFLTKMYNIPDWLLNLHKICDVVLVNLDNLQPCISTIMSYLISFDNTYWLTKGENLLYNKISPNRIYNIEQIKQRIGG